MTPIFKVPKHVHSPMRDYVRIGVMILMLLVILAMFVVLRTQTATPKPPPDSGIDPGAGGTVTPAAPGRPVTVPDGDEQKLLAGIRDDASLAREKDTYYYMLAKIFNMSQEQINQRVVPGLTPFDCMEKPKENRGKFLRFEGSLWRLSEVKMNPESGFESVYEGTIARQGPKYGPYVFCTIILTQKPDPRIQPKQSNVVFSGVFLKRIVYQNQGAPDELGRRNQTISPLFIGRRIDIAPRRAPVGAVESAIFFAIVLAALLVFAYFILFREYKPKHERHFQLPSDDDEELASPEEEADERDAAASTEADEPDAEAPSPSSDSDDEQESR